MRGLLDLAADRQVSMLAVDDDFSQWPLGERGCVESLQRWALSSPAGGRFLMLARQWDAVPRHHPRWARWLPTWDHKVSRKALLDEEQSSLQIVRPMLVLQGVGGMQMLDPERGIGRWSCHDADLSAWWHLGDAISQRSENAMPVTTLGL